MESDGNFKTNGANEDNIRLLMEETAKKYSRLYYAFNNAVRNIDILGSDNRLNPEVMLSIIYSLSPHPPVAHGKTGIFIV